MEIYEPWQNKKKKLFSNYLNTNRNNLCKFKENLM